MNKSNLTIGILAIMITALVACTDNYFEFDKIKTEDWRPELALPLINSSFTLEDIIITQDSNGTIRTGPNNILEISYDSETFTTTGGSAVTIPDQNFNESISLGTIPPLPTGGNIPINTNYTFSFDNMGTGVEIDTMLLKQGDLVFTLENRYQHRILVNIRLKTFTDLNGDTLVLSYDLPAAPAGGVTVRSIITDLADYTLVMNQDINGNPDTNKIPMDIGFVIQLTPNVGSSAGEDVRLIGAIRNVDFREFTGDVGNSVIDLESDTIDVALFANFQDDRFFLSNPFLDIRVLNSYAIPMEMQFNSLNAINPDKNPNSIAMSLPQNPLPVNSPTRYGRLTTSVQLTNTNSNIDSVVSFLVRKVAYDAIANLNPNGPPPANQRNFLTDTSQIALDIGLRLPFEGRAFGFSIIDTVDMEFENTENLDNGIFRIITDNSFPVESSFQIVFADANFVPIDSLFKNGDSTLITSGVIDNVTRDVISSSRQVSDVTVEGNRLGKLEDTKHAIVRAKLSTPDHMINQNVNFKSSYKLSVSVGLKAQIKID